VYTAPSFLSKYRKSGKRPEPVFVNFLRSPGIDSEESIPPAFGGPVRQIGLMYRSARLGIDSWAHLKVYKCGLCHAPGTVDCVKIDR